MSEPTVTMQAPTINQVVAGWLQNAVSHPRSTISGFLSTGLALTTFLLACGCISEKVAAPIFSVNAILKLGWAAFAMKDPGTTMALVPGSAVPQSVPSHGVPNNGSATVVIGPKFNP